MEYRRLLDGAIVKFPREEQKAHNDTPGSKLPSGNTDAKKDAVASKQVHPTHKISLSIPYSHSVASPLGRTSPPCSSLGKPCAR